MSVTAPQRRGAMTAVLSVLAVLGCAADEPENRSAPVPTSIESSPVPSPPSTTPTPTPDPPQPMSLPAFMQRQFDGRGLQIGRVLEQTDAYTRHHVTYQSGDLTISGILNVPDGDGPFPALVLAHGYIDPAVYTNGRGLAREQDYLAREGYVVLHTDYRNHAQSDDDPDNEIELRLGYTEDVVNAVLALRSSPHVELDRVGLLGRSMGGGVTLNTLVVQPGLVDAAVIYASVSSDTVDNFNTWTTGQLAADIVAAYGSPADNPQFWRDVSPRTYFERVTEPLLVHHGTADDTCPIEWSYETVDALQALGKQVELLTYDGQPHAFDSAWADSMEHTAAFFDTHLGTA